MAKKNPPVKKQAPIMIPQLVGVPAIHCKYDALIDPTKLKVYPKNRNKHDESQIDRLAKLYLAHGIRHPIIVDPDRNVMAAGHGRRLAAIRAGFKEFPVVYQKFESDDALYAFAVSDNAIALWAELDLTNINLDLPDLGPDFDIDALGIKDFTLDPAEKEGLTNEDDIPNMPSEPRTKLGDLYQLGSHRLLCGDSTDSGQVSKLMNGEKADMLCWDPPWNVNFEYNEYEDDKTPEEYGTFLTSCLKNFDLVAKKTFVSIVWQSEKNWPFAHLWFPRKARMVAVMKNFVQLSKGYIQRAWDPAFMWHGSEFEALKVINHNQRDYFLSNTAATYNDGSGIRITTGAHPCPRRVDVYEYFVTGWSKQSQIVVDLCLGSGTCLIACEKNNRKCYGMEIDPHYCDVIVERWEKYTGKKAELIDGPSKN